MARYNEGKADPFSRGSDESRPSLQEVDAALYGKLDLNEGGRIVSKGIFLTAIWPDIRQPRRAIPMAVRGEWTGDPMGIGGVIDQWRTVALAGKLPNGLSERDFIIGTDEAAGVDVSTLPALTQEYLELVALAADIHRHGLENPIAVVETGGRYVIESGERRYLAHWILVKAGFSKYDKIPARVQPSDGAIWRQASENGIRKPLNAIGLARQLALLIMDMYAGDEGVEFEDFIQMVAPGEPDRAYYAQVANGSQWRVKEGYGQRILDATGLKSIAQISHYRSLLSVPDLLWVSADERNYPESKIRKMMKLTDDALERAILQDWSNQQIDEALETLTIVKVDDGDQDDETFTIVNVSPAVSTPWSARFEGDTRTSAGPKLRSVDLGEGWYNGAIKVASRKMNTWDWSAEAQNYQVSGSVEQGTELTFLEAYQSDNRDGYIFKVFWDHKSGDRDKRVILVQPTNYFNDPRDRPQPVKYSKGEEWVYGVACWNWMLADVYEATEAGYVRTKGRVPRHTVMTFNHAYKLDSGSVANVTLENGREMWVDYEALQILPASYHNDDMKKPGWVLEDERREANKQSQPNQNDLNMMRGQSAATPRQYGNDGEAMVRVKRLGQELTIPASERKPGDQVIGWGAPGSAPVAPPVPGAPTSLDGLVNYPYLTANDDLHFLLSQIAQSAKNGMQDVAQFLLMASDARIAGYMQSHNAEEAFAELQAFGRFAEAFVTEWINDLVEHVNRVMATIYQLSEDSK